MKEREIGLPSEISFSDNTPSPFLSRDLKRFERLMISASESYEAMNVKATFLSFEFEEKFFILFHSIPLTKGAFLSFLHHGCWIT